MTMRRVRDHAPSLSQALHLQDIGLATPTAGDGNEKLPGTIGLSPTTVFLCSPGQAPMSGFQNFGARLQSTSKIYRSAHPHDGDELHNLGYEEKIATLQKSKMALEKDFITQKALAERLQLELGKVQKQFGISMKEIEEVVNNKWKAVVAEKDSKLQEMFKELKMEKYAAMKRKAETEGKLDGLVPGSRAFDMEVEKVAHDLTADARRQVLMLQHRTHALMDEKKKLRSQSEQSDINAALKWKDAEKRMEEVEGRMDDMKKLLATESMLRKRAERTVSFLKAQLAQAQRDLSAKNTSETNSQAKAGSSKNSQADSKASRPSTANSQRSQNSESSSHSTASSQKS